MLKRGPACCGGLGVRGMLQGWSAQKLSLTLPSQTCPGDSAASGEGRLGMDLSLVVSSCPRAGFHSSPTPAAPATAPAMLLLCPPLLTFSHLSLLFIKYQQEPFSVFTWH